MPCGLWPGKINGLATQNLWLKKFAHKISFLMLRLTSKTSLKFVLKKI